MRIGKMADLSIRATLTQSEEGVWRFSCITCLIDAGAALEIAAMAATATTLSINILKIRAGDGAAEEGGVESYLSAESSKLLSLHGFAHMVLLHGKHA